MSTMRITARVVDEEFGIEAVAPDGKVLTFDGEDGKHGATPMQHLLASVGACSLMDVAHILRKKRLAFRDLRVECVGERPDEGHPKPFKSLKLVFLVRGDVPRKVLEDAARLAIQKYCNVGATLKEGLSVDFEAVVDGDSLHESVTKR
jgi:putative redox protein